MRALAHGRPTSVELVRGGARHQRPLLGFGIVKLVFCPRHRPGEEQMTATRRPSFDGLRHMLKAATGPRLASAHVEQMHLLAISAGSEKGEACPARIYQRATCR